MLGRPEEPHQALPLLPALLLRGERAIQAGVLAPRPAVLLEELTTLAQSKDRMGDILIRMKKLKTPELLEALVEQKASGRRARRDPGLARARASGRHRHRPQEPGREPARGHPRAGLRREPGLGAQRALGHHRVHRDPRRARRAPRTSTSSRRPARCRCATASTASRSGSIRSRATSSRPSPTPSTPPSVSIPCAGRPSAAGAGGAGA